MIDCDRKVVSLPHPIAKRCNDIVVQLEHSTAVATDQVVMAVIVEELEVAYAASEIRLGNQSKIAKKLQRPVDS